MKNVRHVLGISGGKDSAALAIYKRKCKDDINYIRYIKSYTKNIEIVYTRSSRSSGSLALLNRFNSSSNS